MRLLVSVRSLGEAREADVAGVDIIDVKNPSEGALGAGSPILVEKIRRSVKSREVSATIGDLPNLPGTASFAAFGAAASGADYVKVGLYGCSAIRSAVKLSREVTKAVRSVGAKVILAAYADYKRFGGLNPMCLPYVASASDADGVLVDVAHKDGSCVFDYLSLEDLKRLSSGARALGLISALAGGLKASDVETVYHLGFQVMGVRRAACKITPRGARVVDRIVIRGLLQSIEKAAKAKSF